VKRGVFVGIGSNLADPLDQVRRAIDRLASLGTVTASPLYRTPPWGETDQDDFVNAVAQITSSLSLRSLFEALQHLERRAGRTPTRRWGPRVLDLDLLAYDQRVLDDDDLVVPHPGLAERAFVLVPWADIAPDFEVPGYGRVADLLGRCAGADSIHPI